MSDSDESNQHESDDRIFERAMRRLGVDGDNKDDKSTDKRSGSRENEKSLRPGTEPPGSDKEVFEKYLDSLSEEELEEARKTGQYPSIKDTSGESNSSENLSEPISAKDEMPSDMGLFFDEVDDVERIDSSKRKFEPSSPEPPELKELELITPPLPKQGEGLHFVELHQNHQDLLERLDEYRESHSVPTLNLRGKTKNEALDALVSFIKSAAKQDHEYARIVHGRGLRSEGKPVLKPTVLKWLERAGLEYIRGYAPEKIKNGDYGSVVVEFR